MPSHARRAHGARSRRNRGKTVAKFERSPAEIQRRYDERPRPTYPDDLPIAAKRAEIAKLIEINQVVIVAGETGSGKTTQLPKICLDLGRGTRGLIGHTQPRRIAARTVAERIAEELDTEVGESVGYAVRFTDKVGSNSYIKVMTDGILLAELQRDRMLSRYDTLIIDEAHERSLNIDFILGYLKELLPKRPDLKLIITSATFDPESFSRHFDDAPVIEVSGRTYPVEIRYRPVVDPDDPHAEDRDQTQAVIDAVHELDREPYGDVLVFLSGEREIRDTADALRRLELARTDVLPPLRTAFIGRAAPHLRPPPKPPHRAGHQRRRDIFDGARYQVCGRCRYGANF
ncbi:DEAD/DEAH box helicase [Antricoccus suffuscus]|nr:DEAD/DEAH box helicase [Antricoccus suffuscus]